MIALDDLVIEPRAYRGEYNSPEKTLMSYDENNRRLEETAYTRNLRPAEFLQLKAAYLQNALPNRLKRVYEDILSSSQQDNTGEWLGTVLRTKKTGLFLYLDAVGPFFNGTIYVIAPERAQLERSAMRRIDISDKQDARLYNIDEFPDTVIEALCGIPLSEIPPLLLKGEHAIKIKLPHAEDEYVPLTTTFFTPNKDYFEDYPKIAASRGVKDPLLKRYV